MSSANSFGEKFILTTFGESHGVALGAVIDGCPAGVSWDDELLKKELARRRPGSSAAVSARKEDDLPELLSGVYQGKTLGTPIAIIVRNHDARSEDYHDIASRPRTGHADDVWKEKFGHCDPRGGGRVSGRETLARVIGGAIARMLLKEISPSLTIMGFSRRIGPIQIEAPGEKDKEIEALLVRAKEEGKSYGGSAEIRADGMPKGLGQPLFHKLKADLAFAFMGIGATTSFEIGAGLSATTAEGSVFHRLPDQERYGGIRGGISTGEPLILRIGFKPTSTVLEEAKKGRHDPCIIPRAIPVLEAMTALVLADHLLLMRCDQI